MFQKLAAFAALAYATHGVTIKCSMDTDHGTPIAPMDLNKDFRIELQVTADPDWIQASAGGGGVFGYRDPERFGGKGGNFGLYARNAGGALHYAIHAGDVTGTVITTGSFGQPTFYKYDMNLGQTYDMVIEWTGGLFEWTIDGTTVVSRNAPNGFGSHHHVARMCYGVGGGAKNFKGTVKVIQMDYDVQEFHECVQDTTPRGIPSPDINLNEDFRIELQVTADADFVQNGSGGGGILGFRDTRDGDGGNFGLYARNAGGALHYSIHAGDITDYVVTTGSFGHPAFFKFDMERGRTYAMTIEWKEGTFTWSINNQVVLSREAPNGFGSYHQTARWCTGVGGGALDFKGTVAVLNIGYAMYKGEELYSTSQDQGEGWFNSNYLASGTGVIKRECSNCPNSHKTIYYKRTTDVSDFMPYNCLVDTWSTSCDGQSNLLNEDFELYSTLEDLQAGKNKWTFCNYNDPGVGFPRDCGPTGYVPYTWNAPEDSRHRRNGRDVTYYSMEFGRGFTVEAHSGRSAEMVPYSSLEVGGRVFKDRTYTFKNIGDYDADCWFTMVSNNDKNTRASNVQYTIELPEPSIVYLDFWGGDQHTAKGFSTWNSGWTLSDKQSTTFGIWGPGVVYKKFVSESRLELLGNQGNGHGTYYAFVCPISGMPKYNIQPGATCADGYRPLTSSWQACEAAARSLGITGDSVNFVDYRYPWGTDRPQGCFRSNGNNRIHFNEGQGGSFDGNDRILCIRIGTEPEEPEVPEFSIQPKTGCNAQSAQVSDAAQCQLAAEMLGKRFWGGSGHSSGADPKGCIFRTPDNDIYFNTHPTGSLNRGDRKLVCQE